MARQRAAGVGVSVLLLTQLSLGVPPAAAGALIVTRFDDPSPPGACAPGDCSLREAIIAANAAPDADSIQLLAGTYSLSIEGDGDEMAGQGDLDVRADLVVTGAGAGTTVIEGAWPSNPDRLFEVPLAGVGLTMSGVTLRGGDGGTYPGGAVSVEVDASLSLSDAVVTGNRASYGGGLSNYGTLTLSNVSVTANAAEQCCGGILNETVAALTDVSISDNQTLTDSGGMYSRDGTLERVTISGNTSLHEAGGLLVGDDVTLTNVTLSGNSSQQDGGGLYADGNALLNNTTISGNSAAGDGGGLFQNSNLATIRNSIIAGNTDTGGQSPDCGQSSGDAFTSGGHNLIGSTTGCTFTPGAGDLQGVNPLLGPLADNGGPTQTHALLPGSPAVDAGGLDCAATDQRGLLRNCDIGAYELVFCQKAPVNRIGTMAKDSLVGTTGADGLLGFGGNDILRGKGGKDGLCGGPGKDRLKGGGANDRLDGGPGKDTCAGQAGKRDRFRKCEVEKA